MAAREFDYTGSARVFPWYGLAEDDLFVCRCGWRGSFGEMVNEMFEQLVDGRCPQCDTMLAVKGFPTFEEIREAAAAGDSRAAAELASIDKSQLEEKPPSL